MSSVYMFLIALFALCGVSLMTQFYSVREMFAYFSTKNGKKALTGIVIFIGLSVVTVLSFADDRGGDWFNYGELYLGLDTFKGQSPQCEDGQKSTRITSNGGVRANIYRSSDKRFETNVKYTHHSCAFNGDRNTYDGLGVELTYKLWGR